jgi:hypothetical protein
MPVMTSAVPPHPLGPLFGVLDEDRVRLQQFDVSYPLENDRWFRGHTVALS